MNKLCKTLTIGLVAVVLTGCGNNNKEMYEVKKDDKPREAVGLPVEGFGRVEAQEKAGADSDASLGKKHIIMVNGQPIAELIGDYENEYGFSTKDQETIAVDGSSNTIGENNSNKANDNENNNDKPVDSNEANEDQTKPSRDKSAASIMKFIIKGGSETSDLETPEASFVKITEDNGYKTATVDIKQLEEASKDSNDITISNEDNVTGLVVASKSDSKIVFMSFGSSDDMDNALKSYTESIKNFEDNETVIECALLSGEHTIDGEDVDTDSISKIYKSDNYIVVITYELGEGDSIEEVEEQLKDELKI